MSFRSSDEWTCRRHSKFIMKEPVHDSSYYSNDQKFYHQLSYEIALDQEENYYTRTFKSLRDHIRSVNKKVPQPYCEDELDEMERCIVRCVKDYTDMNPEFACTGLRSMIEVTEYPEYVLWYDGPGSLFHWLTY